MTHIASHAALGGGRDASADSGDDGASSRALVRGGVVGRREGGIPSKASGRPLRRLESAVRPHLGFLRQNDVSLGLEEHGISKGVPRVAIASLDGPEAHGHPPSGIVSNSAELTDHVSGRGPAISSRRGRGRSPFGSAPLFPVGQPVPSGLVPPSGFRALLDVTADEVVEDDFTHPSGSVLVWLI